MNDLRKLSSVQLAKYDFGEFYNQMDVRNYYRLGKLIGKGTFGVVRLGTSLQDPNHKVAIKMISRENPNLQPKMLKSEIEILKIVSHPNVVNMERLFETNTHVFFVMELVSGGELFDRLVEVGTFSEVEASQFIRQLLEALKYLHEKGIVHRDLKPQNVLCELDENKRIRTVKISDFGLSNMLRDTRLLQSMVGTPLYIAPELLSMSEGYGPSVDIWAVGCVLYNLLSGMYPFYAKNNNDLFNQVLYAQLKFTDVWNKVSDSAKDLVRLLLEKSPKRRLTAAQALEHPWLQSRDRLTSSVGTLSIKDLNKSLKEWALHEQVNPPKLPALNNAPVDHRAFQGAGEDGPLDWNTPALSFVLENGERFKLPVGTVLQAKGEPLKYFMLLETGSVRVESQNATTGKTEITVKQATVIIGYMSLIDDTIAPAFSIFVHSPAAEGWRVEISKLQQLLDENPERARLFYVKLAKELATYLLEKTSAQAYSLKPQQQQKPETIMSFLRLRPPDKTEVDGLPVIKAFDVSWRKKRQGWLQITKSQMVLSYQFFTVRRNQYIPFSSVIDIAACKSNTLNVKHKENSQELEVSIKFSESEFKVAHELLLKVWKESAISANTELNTSGSRAHGPLKRKDIEALMEIVQATPYKKGSMIVREGQELEHLFYLAEGTCRVQITRPEDDAVVVVGEIRTYEVFGEISFVRGGRSTASIVAHTDCVINCLEKNKLDSVLSENISMAGRFYKYICLLLGHRLYHMFNAY